MHGGKQILCRRAAPEPAGDVLPASCSRPPLWDAVMMNTIYGFRGGSREAQLHRGDAAC